MEQNDIRDKPTEYLRGVADCAEYVSRLLDMNVDEVLDLDFACQQVDKVKELVRAILVVRLMDGAGLAIAKCPNRGGDVVARDPTAAED